MVHLWVLDLPKSDGRMSAPAEPKLLTPGEAFSVGGFDWAPDGKRIAFAATRDPDLISGFSGDIYTVVVADQTVKKIVDTPGPDSDPKWSPVRNADRVCDLERQQGIFLYQPHDCGGAE